MNKLSYTLLILLAGLCSCKKTNNIDFIDINYTHGGNHTGMVKPDCNTMNINRDGNGSYWKRITRNEFKNSLKSHIDNINNFNQSENFKDKKMILYVHYKNSKIDTLCISEDMVSFNGIQKGENKAMFDLISKEIKLNQLPNTFRYFDRTCTKVIDLSFKSVYTDSFKKEDKEPVIIIGNDNIDLARLLRGSFYENYAIADKKTLVINDPEHSLNEINRTHKIYINITDVKIAQDSAIVKFSDSWSKTQHTVNLKRVYNKWNITNE